MSKLRRIYLDSSILLFHLNRSNTKGYLAHIDDLIDQADIGKLQICTSTFSITEVAFIEADFADNRSFAGEGKIEAMWGRYPKILPVSFNEDIAKIARGVKRWQVKNNIRSSRKVGMVDIIHMATAIDAGTAEIYTGEDGWDAFQPYVRIPILRPNANPLQLRMLTPEVGSE